LAAEAAELNPLYLMIADPLYYTSGMNDLVLQSLSISLIIFHPFRVAYSKSGNIVGE
jgi:hypothetical protein